jgi:hypothetical protein
MVDKDEGGEESEEDEAAAYCPLASRKSQTLRAGRRVHVISPDVGVP